MIQVHLPQIFSDGLMKLNHLYNDLEDHLSG